MTMNLPVNENSWRVRCRNLSGEDWAKGKFVELGEGSIGIDFPAILAELESWAFDGWIVLENSRSDISPAHSAQFNADYLRGLGYSLSLPEEALS